MKVFLRRVLRGFIEFLPYIVIAVIPALMWTIAQWMVANIPSDTLSTIAIVGGSTLVSAMCILALYIKGESAELEEEELTKRFEEEYAEDE